MPDGAPRPAPSHEGTVPPNAAPLLSSATTPGAAQADSRLRGVHLALSALVVAVATLLLFALAMRRGLNHDEHQFVAGAALLAREGMQPYRDFAWFHMPTLLYLNAALFQASDRLLLAARSLQVASAGVMLALLLAVALTPGRAGSGQRASTRLLTGALAIVLLITSAAFLHASGRAWNHDLPIALAMGATLAQMVGLQRAGTGGRVWLWSLPAGLLLGLATSVRLTYAPLILPFLLAPWLWPLPNRSRMQATLALGAGLLLGLTPAIYAFLLAPQAFLFGNLRYAQLNTAWYRALEPPVDGLTLPGKLLDGARFLLQPANLPLLALTAAALWLARHALLAAAAALCGVGCAGAYTHADAVPLRALSLPGAGTLADVTDSAPPGRPAAVDGRRGVAGGAAGCAPLRRGAGNPVYA